jgi:hypothetical protein
VPVPGPASTENVPVIETPGDWKDFTADVVTTTGWSYDVHVAVGRPTVTTSVEGNPGEIGVKAKVEFSWGATEVKPPKLADAIAKEVAAIAGCGDETISVAFEE